MSNNNKIDFIIIDSRYSLAGVKMTCDQNSMLTRTTSDFKAWEDVSLDACMIKCSDDKSAALSQDCATKECIYVIYDAKERTCNLADKSCNLTKTTDVVVVYKREMGL